MSSCFNNDDPLGYVYLKESFENKSISSLDVKGDLVGPEAFLFFIQFDTNLQDFDVKNRNQRYYDGDNVWECIMSDEIQSKLRTGGWFGEFDHPTAEIAGEKLSPERIKNVPPKYRAFKIMNPQKRSNILSARIQSAQSQVGIDFGKEVLAGWIPQFSLRAVAKMVSRNGKPYVICRRVITYDAPWYPSHEIAHAISAPEVTLKQIKNGAKTALTASTTMLESAAEKIKDVMVPLKDILVDIGRTDVNAQLVMESFDLDMSDMMGFSNDHSQVMVKDEDNVVYINVRPETVHRVNDFFTSF